MDEKIKRIGRNWRKWIVPLFFAYTTAFIGSVGLNYFSPASNLFLIAILGVFCEASLVMSGLYFGLSFVYMAEGAVRAPKNLALRSAREKGSRLAFGEEVRGMEMRD